MKGDLFGQYSLARENISLEYEVERSMNSASRQLEGEGETWVQQMTVGVMTKSRAAGKGFAQILISLSTR